MLHGLFAWADLWLQAVAERKINRRCCIELLPGRSWACKKDYQLECGSQASSGVVWGWAGQSACVSLITLGFPLKVLLISVWTYLTFGYSRREERRTTTEVEKSPKACVLGETLPAVSLRH
jgi:hypothetical protein